LVVSTTVVITSSVVTVTWTLVEHSHYCL